MRQPPLLRPGARVALVAPAGPLRGEADLAAAVSNVESFSWEPVVGRHASARDGYFAGSDAERLKDFNAAATDESIDAIWCIRGGYGAMRLLPHLDYDGLRLRPRALIGYSDITALHAAIGPRADLVTFHGPTARAELTPFSRASLERALAGTNPFGRAEGARTLVNGSARGRLVGGNLALLTALCGTPFAPSYEGSLLVLEDVDEPVYRIDRMLTQLRLSGDLHRCSGIVFGAFTHAPESEPGGGARTLDTVLEETAKLLQVPCIAGAPVGHIENQWTFPLGAGAELDADNCTLRLT